METKDTVSLIIDPILFDGSGVTGIGNISLSTEIKGLELLESKVGIYHDLTTDTIVVNRPISGITELELSNAFNSWSKAWQRNHFTLDELIYLWNSSHITQVSKELLSRANVK